MKNKLDLVNKDANNPKKSTFLGIVIAALSISAVLGISLILDSNTQRIINVVAIDISDSAQNYKLTNSKLTYPSFVSEICKQNLEELVPGDVYIPIVFARESHADKFVLNNQIQSRLQNQCKEIMSLANGISGKGGTDVNNLSKTILREVKSLNNNNIKHSISIKIFIHTVDFGTGQKNFSLSEFKSDVQQLENAFIIIVTNDSRLQNKFKNALSGFKNVEYCSLDNYKICSTSSLNKKARKSQKAK
ncbi:MAG: hypothetical protein QNJ47_10460 [Nostocaceae cyanobacterium]|nr:hypothetical protein [Nostocaceae cyanobacterium]